MALGLSADFGLIALSFLRKYDQANHNPAKSVGEFAAFERTLTACFLEGKVLEPPVGEGNRFITHTVRKTIHRRCVFRAGSEQIAALGKCSDADLAELNARQQLVVENCLERVRTELHTCGIRVNLQCFDLDRVRLAFAGGGAGDSGMRNKMLRAIEALAARLPCDAAKARQDYLDAVGYVLSAHTKLSEAGAAAVDERLAWGEVLLAEDPSSICAGRTAPFKVLGKLLHFFFSIEDGECQVERDLAVVKDASLQHLGALNSTIGQQAIFKQDPEGPQQRSDLITANNQPTAILLDWGRLWRQVFGARQGLVCGGRRNFAAAEARVRSGGSWLTPPLGADAPKSFAQIHREALTAAAAAGAACKMKPLAPLCKRLSFMQKGDSRHHAALRASPHWNEAQERFLKLTVKKAAADPNAIPKKTRRAAGAAAPTLGSVTQVALLQAHGSREGVPAGIALVTHAGACRAAHLVIITKLTDFFDEVSPAALVHFTYIIGRRPRKPPPLPPLTHPPIPPTLLSHLLPTATTSDRAAGLGKPCASVKAWEFAGRRPKHVQDIIFHEAACVKSKDRFLLQLVAQTPAALGNALRHVCDAAGAASKWRVVDVGGDPLAGQRIGEKTVCVDASFGVWLRGQRRVHNTLGARVWTGAGLRLGKL
jgi:hypothetical protein